MKGDIWVAVQGTKRLMWSQRFWFGPDRLGHLIDVLEWISDQQEKRGR